VYVEGKLSEKQSLWLHPTKPEEELYDLQNDPYELNNLAGIPELQDTLTHLRKVLKDWMKETNDLGEYLEKDLMEKWLINGEQPQLQPIYLAKKKEKITLTSQRADATIIWKREQDSIWNIYSEALSSTTSFQAKAVRIGYGDSEVLEYNLEKK